MLDFFHDMQSNPLLVQGFIAGLLASIGCGLIGPYVITRRIVFLSGAIAHVAVGGIGAAIYLQYTFPNALGWLQPLYGATLSALIGAIIIGYIHHRATERLDTLIGAMWAVGMSAGIMLIKFTPGYHTELMSYLFGNIALVSRHDLMLMFVLDFVVLLTVLVFHKQLLAICLDQQQAAMQGINVLAMNILLLCLVALTVIALIQVVGLILVLALLTLPAATAGHWVPRLVSMCWISIGLCMLLTAIPRAAVYGENISPESAIVLSAAGVYLVSVIIRRTRDRLTRRRELRALPPRTFA